MLVKDAMRTDVKTCKKTDSVKEIASIMCFNKISGLPVVNDDNEIIGIVSEKDILVKMFPDMTEIVASGVHVNFEELEHDYQDILSKKVADIMTTSVATVQVDMPILKAASMMWLRNIRRIPVAGNDKKLIGIIGMGDVHRLIFQETLVNEKK